MKLAFLCLLLLSLPNAFAQKRETFQVNPGQKIAEAIPQKDTYTYAEFAFGNVYFKDGRTSYAKLNYNSLFGDIQFINAKGDTLSLADENLLNLLVIKNDTFYYDKVYVRLIADYGKIKLASRQYFSFTNRQKIGGFGETSDASIDTYDAISNGSYLKDLVAKEILTLSKYSAIYVGDQFNHFKPANKKNILDLFANKQKEAKNYLKENKVDFADENDLRKLIAYLSVDHSGLK